MEIVAALKQLERGTMFAVMFQIMHLHRKDDKLCAPDGQRGHEGLQGQGLDQHQHDWGRRAEQQRAPSDSPQCRRCQAKEVDDLMPFAVA